MKNIFKKNYNWLVHNIDFNIRMKTKWLNLKWRLINLIKDIFNKS